MSVAIRVGIIGLGFMGRTHLAAYRSAERAGLPVRVAAVVDSKGDAIREASAAGNLEVGQSAALDGVAVLSRARELLELGDVDAVSICTPTDTHVCLAEAALAAGKHVLIEKPVALTSNLAQELADFATERPELVAMPAMCMRFWPGWDWLRERIRDRAFGALRELHLRRVGPPPNWAPEFYGDMSRCGDALVDLHVHDVDFVLWAVGSPQGVAARGTARHVTTTYDFGADGPVVVAEGGWVAEPDMRFSMTYRAVFDDAVVTFELGRATPVLIERAGRAAEAAPVAGGAGYDGEIRAFVEAVQSGGAPAVRLAEAVRVLRVVEAERRSLERGGERVIT